MKSKRIILIAVFFSLLSICAYAGTKESLKIYLPREITIEGDTPNLGQVAIIRGSEDLVTRASNITLGRISTPEQNVVIDKSVVLSRLASNGIPASRITLTGAEKIHIKRQHELITGSQFVDTATDFLKNNLPNDSIRQVEALRTPNNLILPGTEKDIKLACQLLDNGVKNQCKVQVVAFQNNHEVGHQEVLFRFRYNCRKVITKRAITKGEMITAENVSIKTGVSNYPEPDGWKAPYGLIATRSLPANAVVTSKMVSAPQPEVLIKRNQSVPIRIESPGLFASATGKALQDGAVGEYIKVQNVDSRIIITAKINEDGTVEPVF